VRLLDSFERKETMMNKMRSWLHQVDVYLEIQPLKMNKEKIHFPSTLLEEHAWD
jgi:hypothetical protein